jgi:hypothetical protein
MSKDNQDKKPQESLEEFSKRVGLKYIREKGGVQFCPYTGGNLMHKRPKPSSYHRLRKREDK